MRISSFAFVFLAIVISSNAALAADPYCTYRQCEVSGGLTCYVCHEPLDNCSTLAYKRVYYYICNGCLTICQSDPPLTGGSEEISAAQSCGTAGDVVFDEQSTFFVIDMSDSYSEISTLMSAAPDLLLQLAASSLEQNSQVENDIPIVAPIDQRNRIGRTQLIVTPEFAHRALMGTLREEDIAELVTTTEPGTVIQIETRATGMPRGRMQVSLRSLLIRDSGLGDGVEVISVLNSAVATLVLAEENFAVVQGFEDRGRIADLYRIEKIEILSTAD